MFPQPTVITLGNNLIIEVRAGRKRLSNRVKGTKSELHQTPGALSSITVLAASSETSTTLGKSLTCRWHSRQKE